MAGSASAQDLEPRAYVNLPIKQNFLAIAYGYSEGDVNTAPAVPLKDAFIRIDGPIFAYARSLSIAGNSAKFDLIQPYLCASGSAVQDQQRLSRESCNIGDTRLRLSYNFYGAPALPLKDFVKRAKDIVIGASLQISAPTGGYHKDRLLNLGANRWFIKPEIGVSFPWRRWSAELAAGAKLFSDNDDYFGGVKLEQDPIYNVQAHLIYDLPKNQWLSFNSNYFFGGKTRKDGVRSPDRQKNSRLGVTYSFAINRQSSFKLFANTGVLTRIGNDSDSYGISWLYRWQDN